MVLKFKKREQLCYNLVSVSILFLLSHALQIWQGCELTDSFFSLKYYGAFEVLITFLTKQTSKTA